MSLDDYSKRVGVTMRDKRQKQIPITPMMRFAQSADSMSVLNYGLKLSLNHVTGSPWVMD